MLKNVLMLSMLISIVGCGYTLETKRFPMAPQPPTVVSINSMLSRYVEGLPVSSEITVYPDMIAKLKTEDPENYPVVEEFYRQIKENPADAAALAEEAMSKLNVPEWPPKDSVPNS